VSHAPLVQMLRGHAYRRPLTFMRDYLDAMDHATFLAAEPTVPPERVIGALHPKMLALAAERAAGAHPYFMPPTHTVRAREILGPGKLLAPELAVVLERDANVARAIARTHTTTYVNLPNYVRALRALGFADADFADGGSDRLVDAIVAWGDLETIKARVQAHFDAGADHVCLQVLDPDVRSAPVRQWRTLAGVLL
jgi:probable F420-dependent oxidoreductase